MQMSTEVCAGSLNSAEFGKRFMQWNHFLYNFVVQLLRKFIFSIKNEQITESLDLSTYTGKFQFCFCFLFFHHQKRTEWAISRAYTRYTQNHAYLLYLWMTKKKLRRCLLLNTFFTCLCRHFDAWKYSHVRYFIGVRVRRGLKMWAFKLRVSIECHEYNE